MTYTNFPHGDLGDQTPGYDDSFDYPHLDPAELNDIEPDEQPELADSYNDMMAQIEEERGRDD